MESHLLAGSIIRLPIYMSPQYENGFRVPFHKRMHAKVSAWRRLGSKNGGLAHQTYAAY
jgi:hypothetical protein